MNLWLQHSCGVDTIGLVVGFTEFREGCWTCCKESLNWSLIWFIFLQGYESLRLFPSVLSTAVRIYGINLRDQLWPRWLILITKMGISFKWICPSRTFYSDKSPCACQPIYSRCRFIFIFLWNITVYFLNFVFFWSVPQQFASPLPFRKTKQIYSSTPNSKADHPGLENEVQCMFVGSIFGYTLKHLLTTLWHCFHKCWCKCMVPAEKKLGIECKLYFAAL